MAYIVNFRVNGRRYRRKLHTRREWDRASCFRPRSSADSVFEMLAAIFIFLVVLAILAGILCLLG